MAEEMKPLKIGDEVLVTRWNVYGKVLIAGSKADSAEDKHSYGQKTRMD
jgi:hypothetical protein